MVVPAWFQLLHGKHAGVQVQKYLLGGCLLCFFIIIIIIFTRKGSNCLPGIAVAAEGGRELSPGRGWPQVSRLGSFRSN